MTPTDKKPSRSLQLNEASTSLNRSSSLFFIVVVAVYAFARLWRLSSSCLWFDEIFTVHAARHSWLEMLRFVAADIIHPPLFYAVLKVWIAIGGESLIWLRLLPGVISVATIIPFVLLARDLKLRPAELNLALLLLAVNGYLIKYAQEVRMYGLLLFFTVTSLWLFVRVVNSHKARKEIVGLLAINLLLVYTHYYGWMVVLIEGLALLIWWRERVREFLMTVGVLVLSYLPWVYLVATSTEPGRGLAQNIGWVTRPGLRDVAQFLTMLSVPFFARQSSVSSFNEIWIGLLVLLLFGLPLSTLLVGLYMHLQDRKREHLVLYWLILCSFVPVLFAFVLSWLLPHSIWGSRHLIITAAPYSLLVAVALLRLRPAWLRTTCFSIVGTWFFLAGVILVATPAPVYIWCAWDHLAQEMPSSEPKSYRAVQVYAFEDLVAYHLWFAFESAELRLRPNYDNRKVTVSKGVPGLHEDPAYFLPRRFGEIDVQNNAMLQGDEVWIAFRAREWDTTRPPLNLILQQGYRADQVLEFSAQGEKAFLAKFRR
ncbi:MAG: glycosyltransferase family 39 protein [bacterium]